MATFSAAYDRVRDPHPAVVDAHDGAVRGVDRGAHRVRTAAAGLRARQRLQRRPGAGGRGLVAVAAPASGGRLARSDFDSWGDVVVGVVIFTSVWVWGDSRRLRREQLEMVQERAERERARDADREERARLAREMHDIVAYSVSVMVVQAGGRPPDGRARPERRRRGRRRGRRPGRDDGARRPARDAPGARRAAGRGRRAA